MKPLTSSSKFSILKNRKPKQYGLIAYTHCAFRFRRDVRTTLKPFSVAPSMEIEMIVSIPAYQPRPVCRVLRRRRPDGGDCRRNRRGPSHLGPGVAQPRHHQRTLRHSHLCSGSLLVGRSFASKHGVLYLNRNGRLSFGPPL